ncbi:MULTISPECIES: phospholipase [unclassified Streptomyces]|uniref:phospholipase n=1 Tax=unclassified Streptomyces TaxID=2593676 RepID=UPI00225AFB64|nr:MULTISPECIES: phospholipase [unclassified Streptomyces]MCX4525929.1 phospholipase [Streptomyces sp. NBC_01551]MCX4543508.1 phospholipase [Streptomyces sp. NBC_01565]
MRRRPVPALSAAAMAAVLAVAAPASATPGPAAPADKPQVLSGWTRTSAASQDAWAAARANRGQWSAYGFDWSTDYCTTSPDNPFGFPFRTACARHDFGYRNYRAAGSFDANKSRLDEAFHADLKRVCARYSGARKTSCTGTAWTYYQAVKAFGVPAQDTPAA